MPAMEPTVTRFEGFEGIHLVGDVRGDPDAWPVVLMHGGGQTRHAWGKTASVLAEAGWRTISLDLRGHGDSEWALNGDYSFTALLGRLRRGRRPAGPAARARRRVARRRRRHDRRGNERPDRLVRAGDRRHHPPQQPRGHRAHPQLHGVGARRLRHPRRRGRGDRRATRPTGRSG